MQFGIFFWKQDVCFFSGIWSSLYDFLLTFRSHWLIFCNLKEKKFQKQIHNAGKGSNDFEFNMITTVMDVQSSYQMSVGKRGILKSFIRVGVLCLCDFDWVFSIQPSYNTIFWIHYVEIWKFQNLLIWIYQIWSEI